MRRFVWLRPRATAAARRQAARARRGTDDRWRRRGTGPASCSARLRPQACGPRRRGWRGLSKADRGCRERCFIPHSTDVGDLPPPVDADLQYALARGPVAYSRKGSLSGFAPARERSSPAAPSSQNRVATSCCEKARIEISTSSGWCASTIGRKPCSLSSAVKAASGSQWICRTRRSGNDCQSRSTGRCTACSARSSSCASMRRNQVLPERGVLTTTNLSVSGPTATSPQSVRMKAPMLF